MARYLIHELSARAVMQNAVRGSDDRYRFSLSEEATYKCISRSAPKSQDDCPLFYQIMAELHPEGFTTVGTVNDLSDILIYIDFSHIFDRKPTQKKYIDWQKKAEDMFRPEGITLDFGRGAFRYVAFERSANMSRHARLSFIREDLYEHVHRRILVGMEIGPCQLSKLYAYNGLMLTSGFRIEDMSIWNDTRIVVVDNPITVVPNTHIITVEDDGTENAVRRYHRVEKYADVEVTEFDGEGLISKEFAEQIDYLYCGKTVHSSFQIRMPYIKGVVHLVDYKSWLREMSVSEITDIWGVTHDISDVDMILTKSMFKGYGWMTDNGLSWAEYLRRCREYRHALYISGVGQVISEAFTEMNYQFLNTAAVRGEDFRPAGLPHGWDHSPEEDERHWITKTTEIEYYRYAADEDSRIKYYAEPEYPKGSTGYFWSRILQKNPLFIREKTLTKEFEDKADHILKQYSMGRLYAAGDNRYLSGDLMRFIKYLVRDKANPVTCVELERECLKSGEFYAPGARYYKGDKFTLLRNPHIARNEEAMAKMPEEVGYYRQKYLSHLSYVIMVDSATLIPERLGGADFDGDLIRTIADPLMNACVAQNYNNAVSFDIFTPSIPVLKIPSATPQIRDANDWKARFETVRSTFDTQIGQICNAAFDRSIIGYDENSTVEERQQLREEAEVLEILTGLEIDSAKSGIKPDLTEYLTKKIVNRSSFLKFKNILSDTGLREWYRPSQAEELKKFFASVDWDNVTSNVEKLPYLAQMLWKHTPKLKSRPSKDSELFSFAAKPGWKEKLDPKALELTGSVIRDYAEAMRRIRVSRIEHKSMTKRSDIERILFMRGQENKYTVDELYGLFMNYDAERIRYFRRRLRDEKWQLMPQEKREYFLLEFLPYDKQAEYTDFFSDFRHNGYRVLGDIICDIDDMYRQEEQRSNALSRAADSGLLKMIFDRYKGGDARDYKTIAAEYARKYINLYMDADTALKCAVALGKRGFVYEVLLDRVEANALKGGKR